MGTKCVQRVSKVYSGKDAEMPSICQSGSVLTIAPEAGHGLQHTLDISVGVLGRTILGGIRITATGSGTVWTPSHWES